MWTKVETIQITGTQRAAFDEACAKKDAARKMFDAAGENYLKALEVVAAVERELWDQIAAEHKLQLGERDYRIVPATNTLQSRPNRHGAGNLDVGGGLMNEANTLADVIGHDPETFPRDPACPAPAPSPSIAEALDRLKTAMRMDPSYAWAWHCNIAMPILDTRPVQGLLILHTQANEMAANVMRHLFDVDVRASREWRSMFNAASRSGFDPNGEG